MRYASADDRAATLHFFRDRPLSQSLFEAVAAYVDTLGPTTIAATKSRVAFVRRTRFLWIHEAPADGIWLAFLLPDEVRSPRLRSGATGKRWSHHLKLIAPPDAELKRWIARAYDADA